MDATAKKLFEDAGVQSNNLPGVLGMILAAPDAVQKSLGTASVVRIVAECAMGMSKERVQQMLEYKPVKYGLGALEPTTPSITTPIGHIKRLRRKDCIGC
jgi:hypothetical protein